MTEKVHEGVGWRIAIAAFCGGITFVTLNTLEWFPQGPLVIALAIAATALGAWLGPKFIDLLALLLP